MRGKHNWFTAKLYCRRITPAHAGKTTTAGTQSNGSQDHPRACGENCEKSNRQEIQKGSPPRMRGKRFKLDISVSDARITPAHAGKTACHRLLTTAAQDHPRACGENGRKTIRSGAPSGSPPRMRGKQSSPIFGRGRARITPAHAGKTAQKTGESGRVEDHPRACGENTCGVFGRFRREGSPPRMRGKL